MLFCLKLGDVITDEPWHCRYNRAITWSERSDDVSGCTWEAEAQHSKRQCWRSEYERGSIEPPFFKAMRADEVSSHFVQMTAAHNRRRVLASERMCSKNSIALESTARTMKDINRLRDLTGPKRGVMEGVSFRFASLYPERQQSLWPKVLRNYFFALQITWLCSYIISTTVTTVVKKTYNIMIYSYSRHFCGPWRERGTPSKSHFALS